jgi:23S rRNA C2498 (ribose-2'-O)-methylase RlmM
VGGASNVWAGGWRLSDMCKSGMWVTRVVGGQIDMSLSCSVHVLHSREDHGEGYRFPSTFESILKSVVLFCRRNGGYSVGACFG